MYASVGEDRRIEVISHKLLNKKQKQKQKHPDRLKSPNGTDKPTKLLKVEKRFMFESKTSRQLLFDCSETKDVLPLKDAVKKGERQTQTTVRSLQHARLTSASYADV